MRPKPDAFKSGYKIGSIEFTFIYLFTFIVAHGFSIHIVKSQCEYWEWEWGAHYQVPVIHRGAGYADTYLEPETSK